MMDLKKAELRAQKMLAIVTQSGLFLRLLSRHAT